MGARGQVTPSRKRLVHGIGINDATYPVVKTHVNEEGKQKRDWMCPYYQKWAGMLIRASGNKKFLKKNPTYEGVKVCDEWKLFSNFRRWMEKQDWEGKHLDKDLLGDGKLYSPETCAFLSQALNNFLEIRPGKYLTGATYDKSRDRYQAQCTDPTGTFKSAHVGRYKTELEAHQAYRKRKYLVAVELAKQESDCRVAAALLRKYSISDLEGVDVSVKIKKLTSTANIPVRATPFAAGADLHADIEPKGLQHIVIGVNERVVIPTGIALSIPSGYYGEIAPRSGLAVKSGIMVMAGILDSDFRGEVLVVLYNSGNTPVVIKQNERIAQLILHKLPELEWDVVDSLDETGRGEGGFGSTGV